MRSDAKRAGLCSICDAEVVEVTERWASGPIAGEPREFGEALPGAKWSAVVLLDGSRMDWLFCGRCTLTPGNLPSVWRRMLAAAVVELSPTWRSDRNLQPQTNAQREAAIETTARYFRNPPIGILWKRPVENQNG